MLILHYQCSQATAVHHNDSDGGSATKGRQQILLCLCFLSVTWKWGYDQLVMNITAGHATIAVVVGGVTL